VTRGLARAVAVAAVAAIAAAAAPAPGAARSSLPRPKVQADAAIVVEARSGEVLYERRPDESRAIASATKLMTALLALERVDLDDVFTAPAYRAGPLESKINLRKGERMKVRDLLKALLLESANDAAATIAKGVSRSRSRFVADMNRRARALGLEETRYSNPVGFDDPGNHSSARDLADLARVLLRDGRFAHIVDLPRAQLRSGARHRVVFNRNLLVRRLPFVDGVKTGHTRQAGFVLVGAATGQGIQVVSVVLGEPSEAARDSDSVALLRYGVDQFQRVRALTAGRTLARADVEGRSGDVRLTAPRNVLVTVRRGERVARRIDAPDELEGPLPAGRRVGTARLVYRGRIVGTAPLVTAEAVPRPGVAHRLVSGLIIPLTLLGVLGIVFVAARGRRRARGRTR